MEQAKQPENARKDQIRSYYTLMNAKSYGFLQEFHCS